MSITREPTLISTDTLRLAFLALEHELDDVGARDAADEGEASDDGMLVLDLTKAIVELRDILGDDGSPSGT